MTLADIEKKYTQCVKHADLGAYTQCVYTDVLRHVAPFDAALQGCYRNCKSQTYIIEPFL